MVPTLEEAKRIMTAAADKAPRGELKSFAPYLRAAIAYWRLQEEATQASGDMAAQVEAVTQRITCEEHFRRVAGRSFHSVGDAITIDQASALPDPR